jgi:hypothetical protein
MDQVKYVPGEPRTRAKLGSQARIALRIAEWDEQKRTGVLQDRQGCRYPVTQHGLGPDFASPIMPPRVGEILTGRVVAPNRVEDIAANLERVEFSSIP